MYGAKSERSSAIRRVGENIPRARAEGGHPQLGRRFVRCEENDRNPVANAQVIVQQPAARRSPTCPVARPSTMIMSGRRSAAHAIATLPMCTSRAAYSWSASARDSDCSSVTAMRTTGRVLVATLMGCRCAGCRCALASNAPEAMACTPRGSNSRWRGGLSTRPPSLELFVREHYSEAVRAPGCPNSRRRAREERGVAATVTKAPNPRTVGGAPGAARPPAQRAAAHRS